MAPKLVLSALELPEDTAPEELLTDTSHLKHVLALASVGILEFLVTLLYLA